MAKKSKNDQSGVISEIKRLGKSFKTDLKKTERVLRQEILRVEERLEGVEERLGDRIDSVEQRLENKIDQNKNDLMSKIDGIAKGLEDLRTENSLGTDQYREIEVRVSKLEAA